MPVSASTSDISVSLTRLPPLPQLAASWRELEARARAGFYTSWDWIGVWLETLPADIHPRLLKATINGRVAGLAVVVEGPRRRLLGMRCGTTSHLHYTGRPDLDIICAEHNDFLLERDFENAVRVAMMHYWLDRQRGAAEVTLFGIGAGVLPAGIEASGKRRFLREDQAMPTYAVDLSAVRDAGGDFLGFISPNSRSVIRRSMREYRRHGDLILESAGTVEQAFEWFDKLGLLHQQRWQPRGQPGSFSKPYFVTFHRALIARHFASGGVQLLRLRTGSQDIAHLYSLVKNGRVYFYQSGLEYGIVEKNAHPGLVAHVMAIEHNARLGHDVYDFMAGFSQYKRTLATIEEEMLWTTLRTEAWQFDLDAGVSRLMKLARTVLARCKNRMTHPQPQSSPDVIARASSRRMSAFTKSSAR